MNLGSKFGLALLAAVIVSILLLIFSIKNGNPGAFPPLPTPNGYDDFIAAGNLLSGQNTDPNEMNLEQLRGFIGTNAESLWLLQLGLTRTCSVHTAEFLTNNLSLITDVMATKRLAQFGLARGRLAELESRTNDAVVAYLTGIRYGNEISRGGFVIHRLVGIACEGLARSRLVTLATNMNVTDAKVIIGALEKLEVETIHLGEIHDNEYMFVRYSVQPLYNPITLARAWWTIRSTLKKTKVRHLKEIAERRLLMLELAIRCYRASHGNSPEQLDDLKPEFFARVPVDPFTERPFNYRREGTNWILRSAKP